MRSQLACVGVVKVRSGDMTFSRMNSYLAPIVQMLSPVHNVFDEAIVSDEVTLVQIDFASVQDSLGIWVTEYRIWKLGIY